LSFNKYNENYNRTFVSNISFHSPQGIGYGINMPYPLVESVLSTFPEIEYGVRFSHSEGQYSNGDLSFLEDNACYVDDSFFKIFSANFLSGNSKNPLEEPYTIVLTKKMATKYFNEENPIGKSLLFDGKYTLKVTAVIDNLPINSDFRYDLFVSMKTKLAVEPNRDYTQLWHNHHFKVMFLLDKNCDYEKLNKKLASFFDDREDDSVRVLFLSPLSGWHLNRDSLKMLIIFGLIALFILIIAGINFINLSIANAANRIKETSIRSILGSSKLSLMFQQLGESVLLSFISFDLAYLLAERLLPNFNAILQTQIPSELILNSSFILSMLGTAILLGLISGIFPAIKISRIKPLRALTGKGTNLDRIGYGKKMLIVIQYAVSVILIISTIIAYQQFVYIKNKDLGFEKESLIVVYVGEKSRVSSPKLKSLRDEVLSYVGVQNVTLCRHLPFGNVNSSTDSRKENAPEEESISVDYNEVELSFFDTYNIDVLSKREFSESNHTAEIAYCFVNQTAVNKLALENPIGERIIVESDKYEIVGVYKDFHVYSVQRRIPAQVFILAGDASVHRDYRWMIIKCEKPVLEKVKKQATATLREYLPDNPYSFIDYGERDFKAGTLNKVKSVEKAFGFFTFIAIIIACMGVFGLVALTVKGKTKELGIRKVLGSSASEIFSLIAREYLVLAFLGNIIAWYPAWYINHEILQDFAYRIDISLWVFVIGFISSILLTIITIAFHTIKAARTNPVDALRYE
jgi:putative ABC transport system permease protein